MLRNLCLPSAALDPEAPSDQGKINVPRLAAFLSCCVALWFYILRSLGPATSGRGGGLGVFLGDALVTFPLAFVAAKAWLWSTRRRGTAQQSMIVLLMRAALMASICAVFLVSASCLHQVLDRAFGGAPTHVFHGRPRGTETGGLGEIIFPSLLDGLLAYFVAGPLVFLGLARPIELDHSSQLRLPSHWWQPASPHRPSLCAIGFTLSRTLSASTLRWSLACP
jgi:hypothetical protein